ncbi:MULTISPECIES: maleylpyruvate isomerase family mycothiol-dependent enzyme [unclassified Nocardioides]|uniref:maleylpyruvate isomerase family mycothiol-dependent enzyme n=1 Tax=Nocardioides sp. URHA0032 TaxID=1380388 RepID=UPI00048AC016|nr:maleylpyruvate isomerase family mycothiol-dependent enzyme [Nocardioides sp. URHA0032]
MSELVDRTIAALRTEHEILVTLLPNLADAQLAAPSGAADWTVAQVLSHLGSGAELARKPIARAAGETVDEEDNQSVWARWDSSSPIDQAAGYVEHASRYLETVAALTPEQRDSLTIDLGFLPEPVPLVVALAMRLNEVANHGWDVRAGLHPGAEIGEESAALLLELFAGPLAFLLGFSGKADQVEGPVRLAVPGGGIVVDDGVTVVASLPDPTATLRGPEGAVVRLLSGRLKEGYADGVEVEGNVSLDDLRRVFPGY